MLAILLVQAYTFREFHHWLEEHHHPIGIECHAAGLDKHLHPVEVDWEECAICDFHFYPAEPQDDWVPPTTLRPFLSSLVIAPDRWHTHPNGFLPASRAPPFNSNQF